MDDHICGKQAFVACNGPIHVENPIKEYVLMPEAFLAKSGMRSHIPFTPLTPDELPKTGDLVGLDAEFVSLNRVKVKYYPLFSCKSGMSSYIPFTPLTPDELPKISGDLVGLDAHVVSLNGVPHKQVIDTAHLFNLPKQRILSLRFLAWFFLEIDIQSGTHDSIEDSRTALQLYRKYVELNKEEDNKWHKELKRLYAEGRKLQWKIPGSE